MDLDNYSNKTLFQTTENWIFESSNENIHYYGFEKKPICPFPMIDGPIRIISRDNIVYTWFLDGTVERKQNNVKTIWTEKMKEKDILVEGIPCNNLEGIPYSTYDINDNSMIEEFYKKEEFYEKKEFNEKENKKNILDGKMYYGSYCNGCSDYHFEDDCMLLALDKMEIEA